MAEVQGKDSSPISSEGVSDEKSQPSGKAINQVRSGYSSKEPRSLSTVSTLPYGDRSFVCPECGSDRLYKDGLRYGGAGQVRQRWLCRGCGYRFSERKVKLDVAGKILKSSDAAEDHADGVVAGFDLSSQKIIDGSSFTRRKQVGSHDVSARGKGFNILRIYNSEHQVGASKEGAKNLDTATETKTVAGTSSLDQQTRKGLIINFMLYMKKQGFRPSTTKNRAELIKTLINQGVNLNNPEDAKFAIADKKCGDGYKKNLVLAYDTLLRMQGKKWDAPKYKPPDRLPFIPLESEIDQLISSVGRRISLFLHVLKETGADPGEAIAIEWIDVDRNSKTMTINHPVKGHKARIITVSRELLNRLDALPKTTDKVFNVKMRTLLKNYNIQRKTAARKFANPRLRKMTFTTFRHWKATMEYHKTKDILWVMRLLGHNSLKTTLIYIDLETALFREANDEFTVRVANTLDEASKLLEVGFEYVCEMEGKTLFKKRK